MLTCREITELVTDFLEGRLTFMDSLRFRMHLAMCPGCRAYLKQVKITTQVLGKVKPQPPTPEMERELLLQFHSWSSTK